MKDFLVLLQAHRGPRDAICILSAVKVTGGYLLYVRYDWGNEVERNRSYLEEAALVVEEEYGPKKGELRLGWTRKISEHTEED